MESLRCTSITQQAIGKEKIDRRNGKVEPTSRYVTDTGDTQARKKAPWSEVLHPIGRPFHSHLPARSTSTLPCPASTCPRSHPSLSHPIPPHPAAPPPPPIPLRPTPVPAPPPRPSYWTPPAEAAATGSCQTATAAKVATAAAARERHSYVWGGAGWRAVRGGSGRGMRRDGTGLGAMRRCGVVRCGAV